MANKRIFAILLAAAIPAIAAAADPTFLGGPVPTNPADAINKFYGFALAIGGLLAFGAIVWGGIRYTFAAGNPSGQTEGKEWIKSALWGLILLGGAYLILNTISPKLTTLALPELQKAAPAPSGGGRGGGGMGGNQNPPGGTPSAQCQPQPSGPCSLSALQNAGGSCFGNDIALAAGVCNVESANGRFAMSTTDKCSDGSSVSIGYFQINISANSVAGLDCKKAFDHAFTGSNPTCNITDRNLYNSCKAAALSPQNNIAAACKIYSQAGSSFKNWGPKTREKCGI